MVLHKKISEVADLFTGHTLRAKMQNDQAGECSVIQLRDVAIASDVNLTNSPYRTSLREIPPSQILKKGDILLLSKGSNNRAMLYEGQYSPAIAVSAFTIIRLKADRILPQFLTWYVNSPTAQEYFNAQRAGTTTLNLSKKAIEELSVPILPLEKQDVMMKLVAQYDLYKILLTEYEHSTRLLIENTLNNILTNNK